MCIERYKLHPYTKNFEAPSLIYLCLDWFLRGLYNEQHHMSFPLVSKKIWITREKILSLIWYYMKNCPNPTQQLKNSHALFGGLPLSNKVVHLPWKRLLHRLLGWLKNIKMENYKTPDENWSKSQFRSDREIKRV